MRTPGPGRILRDEALRQPFDLGLIFHPRQWYLGFREVLRRVDRQREDCPPHAVMNPPAAIEVLFDKPRCHEVLTRRGVPCPRAIGPVRSYDELRAKMREAGLPRVFVKLAHGSSASGVVALATAPGRQVAYTTVELVRSARGLRLYNSRRIRRHEDPGEIAELVDALCRERVHVEQWIPKAGLDGMAFDLRRRRDRRPALSHRPPAEQDSHDEPPPEEPPRRRRGPPVADGAGRLGIRARDLPACRRGLPGLPLCGR